MYEKKFYLQTTHPELILGSFIMGFSIIVMAEIKQVIFKMYFQT